MLRPDSRSGGGAKSDKALNMYVSADVDAQLAHHCRPTMADTSRDVTEAQREAKEGGIKSDTNHFEHPKMRKGRRERSSECRVDG